MRLPNESVIETILAENLVEAFGAELIRRQQMLGDEAADIFGLTSDGSPVLVEIKVVEDRHVLGQLLRYRHRLLQLKPQADRVDYTKPIRLLIVAPSISEQTMIELSACALPVELWCFELKVRGQSIDLRLKRVDVPDQTPIDLPTSLSRPTDEVFTPVPARLESWLSSISVQHGNGIRRFREILLGAGEKEFIELTAFFYGPRKSAPLAEIRFERKRNRPVLFVWLPKFFALHAVTNESFSKTPVSRYRIWSDDDATLTHLHLVAEGFGKMKTPKEWMEDAQAKAEKLPVTDSNSQFRKSRILAQARGKAGSSSITHHSTTPFEVGHYLWCPLSGYARDLGPKALPLFYRTGEVPDFWEILARLALQAAYRKRGSSASNRLA